MLLSDQKITMSPEEWAQFQEMTNAPWLPRNVAEFNAMCDLGVAWHRTEQIMGLGEVFAISVRSIKFGPNNEINFPANPRKMAFIKEFGRSPTPDELTAFNAGTYSAGPKLQLV